MKFMGGEMIGLQRAPRPPSVNVNKRGGRYVVDTSVPEAGTRRVFRQGFAKKGEAEAHANAIRLRLLAGLPPFETAQESRPAISVLGVLEAYQPKTERGEQHIGAYRRTAIASRAAESFDLADMEGFIVERGGLKTCSKDFSFLKRACMYAKAKGVIEKHYFERLAGDKVTRRRLMPAYNPTRDSAGREIPDSDFEAIFGHLSESARRAVLFARTTGCRKAEVASLDWQKHRHPEGFKPIVQKGSGERIVGYDREILGERGIGLVFAELGSTSDRIYQRLTASWRYAVKAAKVPHYRFHDLRHTYGTLLRRSGRTFSDVATIMGISEAMAHVYAHEDVERIQIEAAKLCTNSALSALAKLA